MRIFNFRYLLIATAMLAVWLMGRSRSTQPTLDASWTPITGDMVSTEVPGTTVECKHVGACTDGMEVVVDRANQVTTDPTLSEQVTLNQIARMDGSELLVESSFDGGLDAKNDSSPVDSNVIEPVSDLASSIEEVASHVEESLSPTTMESTDMFDSFTHLETAGELESIEPVTQTDQIEFNAEEGPHSTLADVRPENGTSRESASPVSRIGNRFVTETEDQPQTETSSEPWTKNPFVTGNVDLSVNVEEAAPVQPSRATFAQIQSSVLEAEPTTQVSYPEPDLSQMNHVRKKVTSSNRTLPEGVAQEAVHHIEYGKSLSRRGASFGARQKFFAALGVIARGNDVQTGGNAHTTALGRAIRALREVQDFAVRNADIHVGINVAEILETHQTRIIGSTEAAVMTPVEAMQRYFTFAHQQLSFAGGQNVVTAETLYCLGKLHTVMAKHHPERLDIAKAIVFHRAAVSSDSRNSRSYNELGVLLARSGQLGEAEELFKKSLQITPAAETWQNLAKTHDRQGKVELAQLAQTEFAIASQTTPVQSSAGQIAWLPSQAFNQVGPADFHDSKSNIPGAVVTASRETDATDDANGKGSFKKAISDRFNLKNWF